MNKPIIRQTVQGETLLLQKEIQSLKEAIKKLYNKKPCMNNFKRINNNLGVVNIELGEDNYEITVEIVGKTWLLTHLEMQYEAFRTLLNKLKEKNNGINR